MMPSVLVVCLVVSSTISPVVSVLNGSVMIIGDKVEFKCSANEDHSVAWSFTPWNSSTSIEIYLGYDIIESMRPRYRIDNKISGQHNLIIESVDMAHAGTYRCYTVNFPKIGITHLTVLESNPECGANISHADVIMMDNSRLRMWCNITYAGFMIPVFNWTKNNTQNAIVANTTTSGDRAVPLTTTSSVITQLNSSDNGATFRCKITFQLPSSTDGNAPIYEYTWNYAVYGPRNLSIATTENRLECSADGNPPPTYTWTHVEKSTTTAGRVLELDGAYDEEQTLQCTAVNAIATENKYFTVPGTHTVLAQEKTVSTVSTAGLVLIITSLTVLGIILLAVGLKLTKLSNACTEDIASVKEPSFRSQPSKELISPPPTEEDTELGQQRADASDNYCALKDRPISAQGSQVYCELRLYEQPVIEMSSKEQKVGNKDRVYYN